MADSFFKHLQSYAETYAYPPVYPKPKEPKKAMKFGVSAVASNVKSINNVFSKKQRTAGIVLLEEPMNADFNYFEIKVIDQGMDCKVGIGLGPSPYPGSMHKMPGWDLKCIGYHGDDGGLFNGNGFGQPFGPSCQRGDYMGCGVDFGDCRQSDVEAKGNNGAVRVWFTKNGQVVGNPVEASVPPGGFYPLIGLGTDRSLLSAQYIGHSHKEPPRLPKPSSHGDESVDGEPSKEYFSISHLSDLIRIKRTKDSWVTFVKGVGACALVQLQGPGHVTKFSNYFQIEIVGDAGQFGVGIGLGPKKYPGPFNHMPGWDRQCIGYHSDDGKLFHQVGYGSLFGPNCSEGDTMGCGVDFIDVEDEGVANVWFTKNGKMAGPPISVNVPEGGFYPLIGVGTSREELMVKYLGHECREPPYISSLQKFPALSPPPACSSGSKVTVVYPYDAQRDDELTTRPGDKITVEDWNASEHWARGKLIVRSGYFLKAFTKPIPVSVLKPPSQPVRLRSLPSSHQASFNGSTYYVTEPPQEWLECIICQQIAHEPRQTSCCGHTLCLSCAEEWMNRSDTCPQCRTIPFQIMEDPRAERLVNGLTAFCRNYELGCDWKGSLSRVQTHIENDCLEELVQCPNKCNVGQIHRQHLKDHIDNECKCRKINCPCCSRYVEWDGGKKVVVRGSGMTYSDITSAHYKVCPDWPVRCPNGCDAPSPVHYTRSTLNKHLSEVCPDGDIDCLCSSLGCEAKVKRKDCESHIEEDLVGHFMFLLHGYNELKLENSLLRERIAMLEQGL